MTYIKLKLQESVATSVRVVLSELAERMSIALKEEAELTSAVTRLANKNGNSGASGNSS
jgi:hypothetical protein